LSGGETHKNVLSTFGEIQLWPAQELGKKATRINGIGNEKEKTVQRAKRTRWGGKKKEMTTYPQKNERYYEIRVKRNEKKKGHFKRREGKVGWRKGKGEKLTAGKLENDWGRFIYVQGMPKRRGIDGKRTLFEISWNL